MQQVLDKYAWSAMTLVNQRSGPFPGHWFAAAFMPKQRRTRKERRPATMCARMRACAHAREHARVCLCVCACTVLRGVSVQLPASAVVTLSRCRAVGNGCEHLHTVGGIEALDDLMLVRGTHQAVQFGLVPKHRRHCVQNNTSYEPVVTVVKK